MSDTTIMMIGRISLIPIIIAYITLALYRAKTTWKTNERVVKLMTLCCVLLLISVISAIPKPVTLVTDTIRMVFMLSSMFTSYIVVKHLHNERFFVSIPKDPFFAITIGVCLFVLVANLNRDEYGNITDNDTITTVSPLYATSVIASYILMVYFAIINIYLLHKTTISTKYLIYRARLIISITAFVVIAICCLSTIANIIFAYFGSFAYRNTFNTVYHYGKLIYFPAMFAAIMLPNRTINYLLKPLYLVQENKSKQAQEDIRNLHKQILTIVPSVGLEHEHEQISLDEMILEIADARITLWTNVQHQGHGVCSEFEANMIRDFINRRVILDHPGEYPPIQPPTDEFIYNLSVARRLKST